MLRGRGAGARRRTPTRPRPRVHFHSLGYVLGSIRTRFESAAIPDFITTISSEVSIAFARATPSPFAVSTATRPPRLIPGESFATPGTITFDPLQITSTGVAL